MRGSGVAQMNVYLTRTVVGCCLQRGNIFERGIGT